MWVKQIALSFYKLFVKHNYFQNDATLYYLIRMYVPTSQLKMAHVDANLLNFCYPDIFYEKCCGIILKCIGCDCTTTYYYFIIIIPTSFI